MTPDTLTLAGGTAMPQKATVATISLGLAGGGPTVERNLARVQEELDAASAGGADLICLPETFAQVGCPKDASHPAAQTVPGPVFDHLAQHARHHRTWIIAGTTERMDDRTVQNVAWVLNRQGELAGRYAKVHPTIGEIEGGITPGSAAPVFDTDFGRIGVAICYDIGWPAHWAALAEQGARLIVWPSAYDGGFPLQVYAWSHFVTVVSSVWGYHSKVIDVTGRVLTATSRWSRVAIRRVDLEKEVFHIDAQVKKLADLQRKLGAAVTVEGFSEENVFTVESNDEAWPMARIKREFGLENFRDYHARASRVQDEFRDRPISLNDTASDAPGRGGAAIAAGRS
jgi:beta-ureidopropionase